MESQNVMFSIVIPTFNRADKLEVCINSIISQTYKNWEAIIVDNYSEDNTKLLIESYNDKRIRFIQNHNYGIISISRNKAIDLAKGDWICFLDSDDSWLPNKLHSLLPYIKDYDMIYHGYIKKNSYKSFKDFFISKYCYFYNVKKNNVSYVLQRGDPFNPSCTCVSRKTIGYTRFSEERSLIAVEDYDFFLQLLEKNIKIKYLRKAMTIYDTSGCSHDGKSYIRDEEILSRWNHKLNDVERKEVHYQMIYRKANDLMNTKQYKEAASIYLQILHSNIFLRKYYSIRNYIFCRIMSILYKKS